MKYKIRTRNNEEIIVTESQMNVFLYHTYFGRIILKILVLPFISKIVGLILDTKISKLIIKRFIKKNNINMNEYENKNYQTFNEFFIRKKKLIKINKNKNDLISPCDAKLMVYNLNDTFKIKNSTYTLNELLGEDVNINEGYVLVFRLCVDDYHRYLFIDDGTRDEYKHVKGRLHTVRPIAVNKTKVFSQNERVWTTMHLKNIGDVIEIEVGALLVGKIINHDNVKFTKGDEKGYFKFGASTIVLIVKNVDIDDDILQNSRDDVETIVKIGEKIGIKL